MPSGVLVAIKQLDKRDLLKKGKQDSVMREKGNFAIAYRQAIHRSTKNDVHGPRISLLYF